VYEIAYAAIVLGAVALILSLVGQHSGWPIGSAYFNELILVSLYAAHFRHFDFFPVWSSTDALGLGSPVLLYYQKAFFYVSGAILILFGGALKPTLVVTTGLFLAVGAYGMRLALGMVTESRLLRVVGSVGFLFTNYVFTDWLARGDLPEFSAMMVVPWLLYWCLNLVKNRRVSLLFIPVMALLVDTHSAIGLLSLFTLAATAVVFVAIAGLKGLRAIAPRLVVAVAGATILLAPTLLAELRMTQDYSPATKVSLFGQQVSNNFIGISQYFFGGGYGSADRHVSHNRVVQIDYVIWIPIAITLVAVVIAWAVTDRRPDRTPWGRSFHMPSMLLLLGCLCIYLFLQLRISYFVYRVLSPLLAIDYPFRMLAFITPIGVIVVVAIANSLVHVFPKSVLPRLASIAWLISLIVLSPLTSTLTTPKFALTTPGQFPNIGFAEPSSIVDYQAFGSLFVPAGVLFNEYLPDVVEPNGQALNNDLPLYGRLHNHQDGAASLGRVPCTVTVPARSPLESLSLAFGVTCAGPTQLALPVTYNDSSSVFVKTSRGRLHQISYSHLSTDPRIVIKVSNSKPEIIVVHLPTLWGILG
jgi:hypothetical protein